MQSVQTLSRLTLNLLEFSSLEFAKEAMSNQALEYSEILCIRWAHDDPNPVAQDSIARADKDALYALLKAKGITMTEAGYDYPAEYQMPEPKKIKLSNDIDALEHHPELAYPNTDIQYPPTPEQLQIIQYQAYMAVYQQFLQLSTGAADANASPSTTVEQNTTGDPATDTKSGLSNGDDDKTCPEGLPEDGALTKTASPRPEVLEQESAMNEKGSQVTGPPAGWTEHVDPDTGATYYYNKATKQSSWVLPDA